MLVTNEQCLYVRNDPQQISFTFSVHNYNRTISQISVIQKADKSIELWQDKRSNEYVKMCFDQIIENTIYSHELIPPDLGGWLDYIRVRSVKISNIWLPNDNDRGGIEVSWDIINCISREYGELDYFDNRQGKTQLTLKGGRIMLDGDDLPYDFAIFIFRKALDKYWRSNV